MLTPLLDLPQALYVQEARRQGEDEARVEHDLPYLPWAYYDECDGDHEHGGPRLPYPGDPYLTPNDEASDQGEEIPANKERNSPRRQEAPNGEHHRDAGEHQPVRNRVENPPEPGWARAARDSAVQKIRQRRQDKERRRQPVNPAEQQRHHDGNHEEPQERQGIGYRKDPVAELFGVYPRQRPRPLTIGCSLPSSSSSPPRDHTAPAKRSPRT